MIATSLTQPAQQSKNQLSVPKTEQHQDWMVWFLIRNNTHDRSGMLKEWMELHQIASDLFVEKENSILNKWHRLLEQYIPPFPLSA